jgi:serine/threonine protein kinase
LTQHTSATGSAAPRKIGPYEVLEPLGAGGMGVVYLARTITGHLVALKLIKPDLADSATVRRRFMAEMDHLKRVSSPRVARLENVDIEHDPPWLAIEYVPGLTLREHIGLAGVIPPELGPILGAEIAEGLVAIAAAGLVHRDLKAHNVIMSQRGPVIIDFGLARLAEQDVHLTDTGVAVGTPVYLSPEQLRGSRDIDAKADVYALGALLVFALAGHHLYEAENQYALALKITDPKVPANLSGVPDSMVGPISSMLAYERTDRPTARQVVDTLGRISRKAGLNPRRARQALANLIDLASVRAHEPSDGAGPGRTRIDIDRA